MIDQESLKIYTKKHFSEIVGDSLPAKYINIYLSNPEIDYKTIIIEDKYIDRDYLLDFSNYYSRSFEEISKFT